jgi:hypothetical protein
VSVPTTRATEVNAMLAAAAFPTFAAWLYFVALAEQPSVVQQTAYVLAIVGRESAIIASLTAFPGEEPP